MTLTFQPRKNASQGSLMGYEEMYSQLFLEMFSRGKCFMTIRFVRILKSCGLLLLITIGSASIAQSTFSLVDACASLEDSLTEDSEVMRLCAEHLRNIRRLGEEVPLSDLEQSAQAQFIQAADLQKAYLEDNYVSQAELQEISLFAFQTRLDFIPYLGLNSRITSAIEGIENLVNDLKNFDNQKAALGNARIELLQNNVNPVLIAIIIAAIESPSRCPSGVAELQRVPVNNVVGFDFMENLFVTPDEVCFDYFQ